MTYVTCMPSRCDVMSASTWELAEVEVVLWFAASDPAARFELYVLHDVKHPIQTHND